MRALGLLYHDVVDGSDFASSGFQGGDADRYKLSADEFGAHLRAIARVGRRVGLAPELGYGRFDREPLLMMTFDDGGVSAHTHTAEQLERLGWRGHFFVTTGRIGSPGFLSREQIRALRQRGHVIGSHSDSHPGRMSACGFQELVREWRTSRETLADLLGEDVTTASVPGGYFSRRVAIAAAQAGIEILFTSEPVTRCRTIDRCLVLGRFCFRRGDSPQSAARVVSGDWPPRVRSWLAWNARKVAKRIGGELYVKTRLALLR